MEEIFTESVDDIISLLNNAKENKSTCNTTTSAANNAQVGNS